MAWEVLKSGVEDLWKQGREQGDGTVVMSEGD